jgi:apolipoprotein N-acyltransferase
MIERARRLLAHLSTRAGWRFVVTQFGLGAISALALPPVHAVPVLLLTIPALLATLGAAAGWRRAAWTGFLWGWGFNVAGLYWITEALLTDIASWWWLLPVAVPAIALPLALFMVPVALAGWAARPGWPRLLALAGAWGAMEMVRGHAFTGFPWNLLGTVWAFHPIAIQGAALVGTLGLSMATVLLAGLPLLGRRALLGGAAVLLLAAAGGIARLAVEEPAPHPVTLLLVQGNIAQEAKWREEARWPIFRRYLELTQQGVAAAQAEAPAGHRMVVIWPETASPFLLDSDADARRYVAATLPPDGLLLGGSVRAAFGADGRLEQLFNSLVAVDRQGESLGRYDKAHLVPFGEYMPLRGLLPLRLAHGAIDFSPGPGRVAMSLPGLPAFSPLICYEVIFPGEVSAEPRPDWLLNVTNDAWFGLSAGPYQHLAAARMRAVEEGLPLARAAQTGISAVFDSRGRVVSRLGLGVAGVVMAPLPAAGAPTPFGHFPLSIPLVIAAVLLAAGAVLTRRAQ